MLTEEQINDFKSVADALFEGVPESQEQLQSLQKMAIESRAQTSDLLGEGGYDEVAEEHVAALNDIVVVVKEGYEGLKALPSLTLDSAPAVPTNAHQSQAASGQIEVPNPKALILDEALWKFQTALVFLTICDLLEAYVDVCEAFLGRPAGDKKVGRRVGNALGAVFLDVVTPTGTDAVIEVFRQIVTSPLDEDIKRMRAAKNQNERVETLREALGHLRDQADVMAPGVRSGVDGATEARRALVQGLRELRDALGKA